jgi:PAS domain S-box-containing protein/diguanylate cyclase (GGDEF)-like protein
MLEKVSELDFFTIAEQAVSKSECSGVAVFTLNEQGEPANLIFLMNNGETVDVTDFELSFKRFDRRNQGTQKVEQFSVNGSNLLSDVEGVAKVLLLEDFSAVGGLVFLLDKQGGSATQAELAMELAVERLKLALERTHTYKCPVISTNTQLNQKLELLNEIGSISKTGGWEVDLASGVITWTDEMFRIYGLPHGSPVSISTAMAYFPPETKKAITASFDKVVREGKEYCHEGFLRRADGKVLRIKATGKPRYTGKKVTQVFGALEDITEQYRLLETEYNYAAYLTAILDNLNDVVVTIDTSGTIITANKTMSTIFGYEPDEIMGQDVSILMPDPYAKYHSEFLNHYLETGRAKIIGVGRELPGLHKSGRVFPIELSLSEVVQEGQRQFIGIVKDITERKKAMEEIYKTAYFDDLTELPNMRSFEIDLARVLNQASSQFNALDIYCCLIDMDNFTQYNLSFGKHVGDKILATIAQRISAAIEGDLKVYRGIGDNFLILSTAPVDGENRENENVINTLEWEVHKAIVTPIEVDDLIHSVTAAISSCRLEASKASYEKVNGVLSFGKKRAKKQGPGSVLTLDNAAFEDYNRYNTITHSFQRVLQNNEFYLMLQPQFNASNEVIGSEALIRWEHPELGMISPVEFIPVAEESDAIIDIGNWVINEACRLLHDCEQQGKHTRIAVNISGRHIVRADFAETITQFIEKWGLAPDTLMLEITETTLVSSIDLVRERMDKLGELGFSFSIDDFGTGYSSLSYLKELPISELKIDRYFVDEINFHDDEVPIVNSIIDLAHALGVSSVAEGIENEFQREYLRQRGCEYFQGYFYSRPLPEKAWRDFIMNSSLSKIDLD